MGGLWGGRDDRDQAMKKQTKQAESLHRQEDFVRQYDEMVTAALTRLTRWAFPGSQVECQGATWQLWHTTEAGKRYVDVSVTLQFQKDRPGSFLCSDSLQPEIAKLTREDLDDALRMAICSLAG